MLAVSAEKRCPEKKPLRQHLISLGEAENLQHKGRQPPQQGLFLLQDIPGLQIQERAGAAGIKTRLQLSQLIRAGKLLGMNLLLQKMQNDIAVRLTFQIPLQRASDVAFFRRKQTCRPGKREINRPLLPVFQPDLPVLHRPEVFQHPGIILSGEIQIGRIKHGKRILRIRLPHVVNRHSGAFLPGVVIQPVQQEPKIIPQQPGYPAVSDRIRADLRLPVAGDLHLILQRLMNTAKHNFPELPAFSDFIRVHDILQPVHPADKILGGNGFLFHLQEITLRLYLNTHISPGTPVQIERVLLRCLQVKHALLLLIKRKNNRLLFSGRNQEFLQMLICDRIMGHALIESSVRSVFSVQDTGKLRIGKQTETFPETFLADLGKILQRLHLRIKTVLSLRGYFRADRDRLFTKTGNDRYQSLKALPRHPSGQIHNSGDPAVFPFKIRGVQLDSRLIRDGKAMNPAPVRGRDRERKRSRLSLRNRQTDPLLRKLKFRKIVNKLNRCPLLLRHV